MKIKKYLEQSPVFSLNFAYEAVVSPVNQYLRQENLNLLQGLVLTALVFETVPIRPSQLATALNTSRANVSHIISHLEAQGWVKRVVNSKDARQFEIILKPEGKKKALKLIKFYDRLQEGFERELGISRARSLAEGIRETVQAFASLREQL